MEENFWERKGVKLAFVWIFLDVIMLALFLFDGFSSGFAKAHWILPCIVAANMQQIIFPIANLPEPPRIFVFLSGIIPAGLIIAYFVSLKESVEGDPTLTIVLFAALLLWNAANIGWGILEKKKQNKKIGL